MRTLIVTAAMAAMIAGPANAQEWQAERNALGGITAAVATWPTGHAVVVRCDSRDLQVFLRFARTIPGATDSSLSFEGQDRVVRLSLPFGQDEGQVLFTQEPARAARWMMGGGMLHVEAPGQEAVDLELPRDGAPIRAALEACNRPLEDRRDTLLRAGRVIGWDQRPNPDWPRRGTAGAAVVSLTCIVAPRGRLEDCVVERETPLGQGFGDEALRAARRARVNEGPADLSVGALVPFDVRFQMGN